MDCMSLDFIKPQLATSVDQPPPRAGWIHEVKHDGYRTLLLIERRKARAYTRNGFDWSESYSGITKAAAKLGCRSAIIDGCPVPKLRFPDAQWVKPQLKARVR